MSGGDQTGQGAGNGAACKTVALNRRLRSCRKDSFLSPARVRLHGKSPRGSLDVTSSGLFGITSGDSPDSTSLLRRRVKSGPQGTFEVLGKLRQIREHHIHSIGRGRVAVPVLQKPHISFTELLQSTYHTRAQELFV